MLLDESIELAREALALQPTGGLRRASSCDSLARALHARYRTAGTPTPLDEATALLRESLALRSPGHPDRGDSCHRLATILYTCYKATCNTDLIDEMITLHSEVLSLRPASHPGRAMSCNNLATALNARYKLTGDIALLDQAITMDREALELRPAGHPDRVMSCNDPATVLHTRCRLTGSTALLGEAIKLDREALALYPAGHPDRAMSCNNLATALHTYYKLTGITIPLDESVTLLRESLALRSAGHLDRGDSCHNLATILYTRYKVTGNTPLLDETITLHSEALALRPTGHPDRADSCNDLANALQERFYMTGSTVPLDDMIRLHREALALRPAGHLDRAMSCNNLATALHTLSCYELTSSTVLLDEAITLDSEALSLRPVSHPDRVRSCYNLADTLWRYFKETRNLTVVDEALDLARECAEFSLPSNVWRVLLFLCQVHLHEDSPHFSISTAMGYLLRASVSLPNNITKFMRAIQRCLSLMWSKRSTWTADTPAMLLDVYWNVITKLPRMTGFVIGTTSQLAALKSVRSFGSDACIAALLSGRPCQALELIDHAQGIIWAQALHQRDPQLQDLPTSIASELETLLRAVSAPIATDALSSSESATCYRSREDVRHQQNSRIQAILTEVRAMPGLKRFMLGKTYAQLRQAASTHPVVVLVSAQGHVYALVIPNAVREHPDVLPLKITSDRLALLRHTATQAGLRTRKAMQDINNGAERYMGPGRFKDTPLGTLADLWKEIVKPVVDYLQLPVRIWPFHLTILTLICAH
jgi:hypothetical protein